MKYTQLGTTGIKVSRLGFGCMRFPMTPEGKVDRRLTIPLLHRSVELGINYFDTAIGYCGSDSQRVLGEAFEGMRDRLVLSTKNHMHEATADVWWQQLIESLNLLRTEYIDIYNFHGLTWDGYTKHIAGPQGKLRLMEKARDQGKVRFICCSFHDSPEALLKIAKTRVFSVITLQYNLLYRDLEDTVKRVRDMSIGVVVMGPVGGGRLGVTSERIRRLTGGKVSSTPEAALRFVLANPGVAVALSGMSNTEQLEENVQIVSEKEPFTQKEIRIIEQEAQRVKERIGVKCPACGYCKPCPAGVDIPGNFAVYNEFLIYGLFENARHAYNNLSKNAAECILCGACVSKCPQKINIPAALQKVVAALDSEYGSFVRRIAIIDAKNGMLKGRITVKNLSEKSVPATVTLHWDIPCSCTPKRIRFGTVPSFATRSRIFRIKPPDGTGILECAAVLNGEESDASRFRCAFFLIPRKHPRVHCVKFSPADFRGDAAFAAAHGYSVTFLRDNEKIHVILDIRSQMHAPGKAGKFSGARVEMFVDMRSREKALPEVYTDGAEHFVLCLLEAGYGTVSKKRYTLNMRNERTPEGCRITFDLLFREFLTDQKKVPQVIGLDFMFVAANDSGIRMGRPVYGGKQELRQRPGLFARAYLT